MLGPLWPTDGHVQVPHQAVGERIDPAMDAEILSARPGVLDEDVGCDVPYLADDVELAQAVESSPQIRDCVELVAMLVVDLANGMQPVVHEPTSLAVDRCGHSAARTPTLEPAPASNCLILSGSRNRPPQRANCFAAFGSAANAWGLP